MGKRELIQDDFQQFELGDDTYCNCFRALHRDSKKTMRLTSKDAQIAFGNTWIVFLI